MIIMLIIIIIIIILKDNVVISRLCFIWRLREGLSNCISSHLCDNNFFFENSRLSLYIKLSMYILFIFFFFFFFLERHSVFSVYFTHFFGVTHRVQKKKKVKGS